MGEAFIDQKFGREAFGADPGSYHLARPAYPDWVFEVLCYRCGLAHGAAIFEIGAGTGTATRRLLDLGANPLVAIEPDARLATFLRETIEDRALTVVFSPFEDAAFRQASFDLGVSATAFHWLNAWPILRGATNLPTCASPLARRSRGTTRDNRPSRVL